MTVALVLLALAPASAQSLISPGGSAIIDADEECVILRLDRQGAASIQIQGTGTATFQFEATAAGAATCTTTDWVGKQVFVPSTGSGVTSATAAGAWETSAGAWKMIRVRASAYSSGTWTVTLDRGQGGGTGGGGGGSVAGEVAIETPLGDSAMDDTNDAVRINCVTGCAGGTSDTDDGSVAGGQVTGIQIGLNQYYNGTAWVRMLGNATDGLLVNLGTNNDVTVTGTVTANLSATDNAVLDDIADGIPVTNAGTFAVQVNGDALTALQLIDNLVLAESATHSSGEAGVLLLGVRNDAGTALATDGQRIPLSIDSSGAVRVTGGGGGTQYTEGDTDATITGSAILWENTSNTLATVSASTPLPVNIVAGGGSGGTALADDADFTAGTTSFTPVGGFYQSSVTACTDGDTCAAGITAQRTLKTTLYSAAGAELTPATDSTTGSAVATTGPLSQRVYSDFDGSALPTLTNVDTEGEAVPAAATIKGVQYVMLVSEDGALERGTSTTPLIVGDGSGALNVIVDSGAVTVSATNLDVQSGGADLATTTQAAAIQTAVELLDNAVSGAGFNITQLAGAATPMTTTQADDLANTLDALNVTAFGYVFDGTTWDRLPGDSTNGVLVNLGGNNDVVVTATDLDVQSGGADILSTTAFNAAFGTAGSADSQVMSIQGIASMTPVTVTATNLDVQIGGSDTVQVQSNSANLATETSLASALTALQLIDDDQTGASVHYRTSAGSTEDEHEVKGSAGRLFSVIATNTNAAVRYLRCANQVIGSTTPGTTTVYWGIAIPGATTGAGFSHNFGPAGMAFSTGLTCWLVTGAADTDVAEVAANEIKVTYTYK